MVAGGSRAVSLSWGRIDGRERVSPRPLSAASLRGLAAVRLGRRARRARGRRRTRRRAARVGAGTGAGAGAGARSGVGALGGAATPRGRVEVGVPAAALEN